MARFWKTKEGKRILIGAAIVLAIVLIRIIFFGGDTAPMSEREDQLKEVEVARVLDVTNNQLPIPLVGRVESKSEAVIRSEASGEVARVTVSFGDRVGAGQTIAELKNDAQRAEVLRAQGSLQAAQAALQKIQRGTGDNQVLIKESVRSAYTTSDDAVRNKADQFIEDPESAYPEITTASSDYFVRQRAEEKRAELNTMFSQWEGQLASLNSITTSEALVVYVLQAQSNLEQVREFLDDMAIVVAGFEPNDGLSQGTIDKYRADISTARSSVNGELTSLISTYNNLRSQLDASGGSSDDVLAAEAQVTQAEAGVLAAQAALAKTIIRSPITGEVNQIDIQVGDFVSATEEVAVVANNNALEITTFVGEMDRKAIAVGSSVEIEGGYSGVVTRIAPALNKQTGKIEVAIGVDGTSAALTNGQSVALKVQRVTGGSSELANSNVIMVPISALKITATTNYIFTVSPENKLIAHEVAVGSIVGEKIIITDGITATMEIVLDARGLDPGEEVLIK